MSTETEICNRALAKAGARSRIAALSEDSAEAEQCRLHFACTRQSVLRAHNWSFARRQVALAVLGAAAGTPENPTGAARRALDPWQYEYLQPDACLRFRSIHQPAAGGGPIAFDLSSDVDSAGNGVRVVLTNQAQAVGIYTVDVTVPDLWDPMFEDAVIWALAADLAMPISGDKAIWTACEQTAATTLIAARTADGAETQTTQESIPDWVAVRGFATSSEADSGFVNALLR